MSTPAGHERGLVVRRSRRRQLPALLAIAAFLASYVLGGLTGSMTGWIVPAGIALFSVLAVIGLVDLARSGPRSTALLRIGPAGVEVPEVATVSWSDLDDVRVRPTRWFPGFSVVAFIPRPGVPVPSIPRSRLSTGAMRGTPEAITARYGSPLVLLTAPTTATNRDVLDAVHRYSQPTCSHT